MPDDEKLSLYRCQLESTKALPEYADMLTKIPAKISVSQLKKGLLDEEIFVRMKPELKKLPDFMLDKKEADGAEKGSAAHIFMQFANYENIEKYGAEYEADRLQKMGFITRRMRDIVNLDTISRFIKSKLYLEVKNSKKQYRERRFNLRLPANEFSEKQDAFPSDAFVLVQGVSDLYFENSDGTLTIVDFKTDRVSPDNGENTLLERHTNQLIYYKRAIEEITQKKVSRVYIYSFSLGKEILLEI